MKSDDADPFIEVDSDARFEVRPVLNEQWTIIAWLWQSYRNDVATVVGGLPYSNGRYQAALLDELPSADGVAYIAWRPHTKTGEDAPIAFAVINGLTKSRRTIEGFWVTPVVRHEGIGIRFAQQIISRHDGPWTIAFQHDNVGAGIFWRNVANKVFGLGRWTEEERPVPGLPSAPPDHFIEAE